MDSIIIGTCTENDNLLITQLIANQGIKEINSNSINDSELIEGLNYFCSKKNIKNMHYLHKSATDDNSNTLTQEIFEDLANRKQSRVNLLAKNIETAKTECSVWLLFAFTWQKSDEISLYSGNANELYQYMLLNGGAYRLTYVIEQNQYNIDLDTPLIWELTSS